MARLGVTLLLLIATLQLPALAASSVEKRVALVIGNSTYKHAGDLANPKNDADDVSRSLEKLGFTVIKGLDLDKRGMEATLHKFASALDGSKVGVFFYAGHGLQVSGRNYMVPIDAKLSNSYSVDFELIRLDLVHRTMERASKTNILFLDACRDNPLARNLARAMGTRSSAIGRGLATMEAGVGTLISFSTQPGNVALDGFGRNSPYAKALVKQFARSRSNISDMLIRVRRDVMSDTQRKQVPWEHSALTDQFYFSKPSQSNAAGQPKPNFEKQAEIEFWKFVKSSNEPAMLNAYLKRYPTGA